MSLLQKRENIGGEKCWRYLFRVTFTSLWKGRECDIINMMVTYILHICLEYLCILTIYSNVNKNFFFLKVEKPRANILSRHLLHYNTAGRSSRIPLDRYTQSKTTVSEASLLLYTVHINIDLIDIPGEKEGFFFLWEGKGVLRANRIDAQQESLRSAPFLDQSLSRGLGASIEENMDSRSRALHIRAYIINKVCRESRIMFSIHIKERLLTPSRKLTFYTLSHRWRLFF